MKQVFIGEQSFFWWKMSVGEDFLLLLVKQVIFLKKDFCEKCILVKKKQFCEKKFLDDFI